MQALGGVDEKDELHQEESSKQESIVESSDVKKEGQFISQIGASKRSSVLVT